jgi:hypothetical protein
MSRNTARRLATLALAAFGTLACQGALADTKTAGSSATVMIPLVITKTADLRFGSFAPTAAAGTVTIATTGARSSSGVQLSSMVTSGAAAFSLAGDTTATYAITLPSSATLTSGANSMTINSFTSNPSGTGALVAGAGTVAIGGTLAVAASQAAGSYTGTFSVTMNYN